MKTLSRLLIPTIFFSLFSTLATGQTMFVGWGSDYNMLRRATSDTDSTPQGGLINVSFSSSNLELGGGSGADSRVGTTIGDSQNPYLAGMIDPNGADLSTRNFTFIGEQIRYNLSPSTGSRRIGPTNSYNTNADWRGNATEQYQMYAWQRNDFLSSSPIILDSDSFLRVTINAFTNITDGSGARFVINNGGTWYYSQASTTAQGTFLLEDPASALWASFDPLALSSDALTARSLAMPGTATFNTVLFNDIQWVGFASEVIRLNGTAGESRQGFDNFEFVAAIPEPSTYAVIFGLVALGGILLRRRLRK